MAYAKTKAFLITSVLFLLTGCGGRTLAQREIVRAVFFEEAGQNMTVCLLLQDQNAPEGETAYKTATAEEASIDKALNKAEERLEGEAYYGLTDLVAVPFDSNWEMVRDIGDLIYQKAQPTPEIELFSLPQFGEGELEKQAGGLYDTMQKAGKTYQLHCGLQQVFAQQKFCALPTWQGNGYGMLFLRKGSEPIRYSSLARAQLAAVLCGQAKRFSFPYHGDDYFCTADVRVSYHAGGAILHLTGTDLQDLTGSETSDDTLQKLLNTELQIAFSDFCTAAKEIEADPFRLNFWSACRYGPGAKSEFSELLLQFE